MIKKESKVIERNLILYEKIPVFGHLKGKNFMYKNKLTGSILQELPEKRKLNRKEKAKRIFAFWDL